MSTFFQTLAGYDLYRSECAVIQQNFSYRWLVFQDDACIQTLVHRRHPHKAVMPYLVPFTLAVRAQPGPVCLLGLGGGAVIHLTASHIPPSLLTAVEARAEVIALAKQYFWLDTIQALTIVQQEAQTFIAQTQTNYQHMLIDLYSDTGFPKTCAAPDFFYQCKQRLEPHGFLALNLVGIQQEFHVLQQLKSVFHQASLCIPVPNSSNMIVLATHSKSTLLDLVEFCPTLKTLIWDPVFGYMAKFK